MIALDRDTSKKLIIFYGSIEKAKQVIKDFNKGIIIICPKCGKIDIYPPDHIYKCDPEMEAYLQESRVL